MRMFAPDEPPPDLPLHIPAPLGYGGRDTGDFAPLAAPLVNLDAARRPLTPGLPPLFHLSLPAPATYRIVAPQQEANLVEAVSAGRMNVPRVPFPVAGPPPGFRSPELAGQPDVVAAASSEAALIAVPDPSIEALAAARSAVRPSLGERFDPLYPLLVFLALGIGTIYIDLDVIGRYTILWSVLIFLGAALTLVNSPDSGRGLSAAGLGWGVSFGLVFSLPLLILVSAGLAALSGILFPEVGAAMLFQSLVFVGPIGETLFFRGALQQQRGFAISVMGAGLSSLVFFWPAAAARPVYLAAAVLFSTVLAGVYSFVRTRYGLAAAYICQVTVNLLLFFIPGLFA